jgi:hypothetical protein
MDMICVHAHCQIQVKVTITGVVDALRQELQSNNQHEDKKT